MSLGIAYAGYRTGFPGPLLHKTSDGLDFEAWDGTSWYDDRPIGKAVGPGTEYPIAMTLNQVADMVWRLRKLKMESSLSMNLRPLSGSGLVRTADSDSGGASAVFGTYESRFGSPPRESQVIMGLGENAVTQGISGYPDGTFAYDFPDVPTTGTRVNAVWLSMSTLGVVRYFSGSYYPLIVLQVSHQGVSAPASVNMAHHVSTTASRFLNPYTSSYEGPKVMAATLDFLGISSIPLYGQRASIDYEVYAASGSLTVTAEEWWGYGGKFDTATGARL